MTQKQSKDELLHQMAIAGNVDAVKALFSEGASLEWIDREGKTPLIVACMDSGLYNVAKVLIEMGANVDAYRPGRHAGTPLHHAVKRGQEQTVKLLLSSGANALVRNDDCQTALDVARVKRNINVVRAIESHIGYFNGCLREFYGPGFLKAFAPQFLSRKIWAAVIPQGSSNPKKLELAIYPCSQDAQPRTVIALWNAKIEESNFNQPDPELTIFDQSTKNYLPHLFCFHCTKTQYRLASANEGDKQQLHWLYDACSGIPRGVTAVSKHSAASSSGWMDEAPEEDHNGWGVTAVSKHSAASSSGWMDEAPEEDHNGRGVTAVSKYSAASSSGWMDEAPEEDYDGCTVPNMGPSGSQGHVQTRYDIPPVSENSGGNTASVPSAPPIPDEALDEGSIHYPSIDFSKLDLSVPAVKLGASVTSDVNEGGTSSSCIICWEAPVEGACVPCGHMAGCMPCLSEIKATKGVCPVCRSNINQVIRIYAV
ncbi:auxin-regulated protein [Salix suchowensis]|nr:auxin-regulated protein [Salix suchowensis]